MSATAPSAMNGSLSANFADGLPIFPGAHREKLAASGLSDETIREAGIRSCGDVAELAAK